MYMRWQQWVVCIFAVPERLDCVLKRSPSLPFFILLQNFEETRYVSQKIDRCHSRPEHTLACSDLALLFIHEVCVCCENV